MQDNGWIWNLALITVVSLQCTVMAYVHHPKLKAFVYSLPFPFTFAVFVTGGTIEASNVLGLLVLLVYIHSVRLWYHRLQTGIWLAIALSALTYCLLGTSLFRLVPPTSFAFWVSCGIVAVVALINLKIQPHRDEPGHRTPLPLYMKLPVIVAVVSLLVMARSHLGGFMTTFPMVGILGAYESRHSLWTMSRQFPRMMISMLFLMSLSRTLLPYWGLYGALAAGWVVCLPLLCWISFRPHK